MVQLSLVCLIAYWSSMKKVVSYIIKKIIVNLARMHLALHKPKIIAITGSVGKTTTKDIVVAILQEGNHSVRASPKSYNSEFGVPLSILGMPSGRHNPFLWLYIVFVGFFRALFDRQEYCVLEVGLENPGDIKNMVGWLKPDISVLTRLPRNPVHLENFPNKETLYLEKICLLKETKKTGTIIYNEDDSIQKPYIDAIQGPKKISFNSDELSVAQTDIHYDQDGNPIGTDVVLSVDGAREPMYIPHVLGTGIVQSLIAAVAVARASSSMPFTAVRKAVASRSPTPGRMRILSGKQGSTILDDSYNASPIAMEEALNTLCRVKKRKKIAILGVMAQLGDEAENIHYMMGKKAAEIAEHVFVIGDAPYGSHPHIHYLKDTEKVIARCLEYADEDTIFLCKGSQVARVEKIIMHLLAPGIDPNEMLVRTEPFWK